MILHPPFAISSRLLPALQVGKAWIQLEYAGQTNEGRTRYRWTIDLPDGSEHTGNDLKSGCGGGRLQEGFASLLSFLGACGESVNQCRRMNLEPDEDDNASLFPPAVAQWAADNEDELSMLACELEEAQTPLIEE